MWQESDDRKWEYKHDGKSDGKLRRREEGQYPLRPWMGGMSLGKREGEVERRLNGSHYVHSYPPSI